MFIVYRFVIAASARALIVLPSASAVFHCIFVSVVLMYFDFSSVVPFSVKVIVQDHFCTSRGQPGPIVLLVSDCNHAGMRGSWTVFWRYVWTEIHELLSATWIGDVCISRSFRYHRKALAETGNKTGQPIVCTRDVRYFQPASFHWATCLAMIS